MVASCWKPTAEKEAPESTAVDPAARGAPRERNVDKFECTWTAETHELGEIGFNLPDAAFALSLPEEQRTRYKALRNEDTLVIGDAHFVRGWAPLRIEGMEQKWGLGLWIKISAEDFEEFETLHPNRHPTYRGAIANQSLFGAPTLGTAAEMVFRPQGLDVAVASPNPGDAQFKAEQLRPEIRFGGDHPLARFQASGVPVDTWRRWLSDLAHEGDPEPAREPFEGELAGHGWMIHAPQALDKEPARFAEGPKVGDTVKAVFGVVVSDERGQPTQMNAGWWITLDDVARSDLWSGTLSNYTRVPATITLGSRIWVTPKQVIQHMPANSEG